MEKKDKSNKAYIGAHFSASGGLYNALIEAFNCGASCLQLFTANQKRWQRRSIQEDEIAKFHQLRKQYNLDHLMSHASYLINVGSPDLVLREKSIKTFCEEIETCHLLGIDYLCFHPGSATTSTEEACLDAIIKSLSSCKSTILKGKTLILMETTAGQGSVVGWKFSQLGYIIKKLPKALKNSIAICLDTCHVFAAGYDIKTKKGWQKMLKEFDQEIGLSYLKALHVNDSKKDCGTKVDRHASLGEGFIGKESFNIMMNLEILKALPKYLETPQTAKWEQEIQFLINCIH